MNESDRLFAEYSLKLEIERLQLEREKLTAERERTVMLKQQHEETSSFWGSLISVGSLVLLGYAIGHHHTDININQQ